LAGVVGELSEIGRGVTTYGSFASRSPCATRWPTPPYPQMMKQSLMSFMRVRADREALIG